MIMRRTLAHDNEEEEDTDVFFLMCFAIFLVMIMYCVGFVVYIYILVCEGRDTHAGTTIQLL
jgi:hypothetical protein